MRKTRDRARERKEERKTNAFDEEPRHFVCRAALGKDAVLAEVGQASLGALIEHATTHVQQQCHVLLLQHKWERKEKKKEKISLLLFFFFRAFRLRL